MSVDIRSVADQLTVARRERKPISPFTDEHPDFDFDAAYDAQDLFVDVLREERQRVIGAKLGLTSRAKQQVMGVSDPLYGWLTDTMVVEADNPVPVDELIHPRAEPEVAFLLARDLEGPASVTSVLAATEVVFAAMDILDSRYENYRFKLPDVVADNCSSGAVVLGSVARHPEELEDLRLVGCVLRDRGTIVATAAGAATMGHPANSIAWLANRLAARGRSLPAGSLVLSGGLTAPVPLPHGGFVTAEFDGLGTVEAWA